MSRARGSARDRRTARVAVTAVGGQASARPRQPRRSAPSRPTNNRWLVIGLGVVGLAVLAAIAVQLVAAPPRSGSAASGGPASTAAARPSAAGGLVGGGNIVEGAPLAALPQSGADPAVGATIPTINGAGFDGRPIDVRADGRPKVIIFLAHWCSHCQAEVPRVQAWLDAGAAPPDIDIRAVSTAADPSLPNFPPAAWLEREGWTVPTVEDDATGSIAAAYGLTAFPYFVFVDADGTVARRVAGELSTDDLDAFLGSLER